MSDFSLRMNMRDSVDRQKIQRFLALAGTKILVGFPSGRTHIDTVHEKDEEGNRRTTTQPGKETAELAKELTFGSSEASSRPFLKEGLESKKEELLAELYKQSKTQFETGTANWNKVGVMAVGAVQEFVRSDYYKTTKPNSPEWIEEKGSDRPLIDGGDLINAVEYIVEDGEE